MIENIVLCITGAVVIIIGTIFIAVGVSGSPHVDNGEAIACFVGGLFLVLLGCFLIFGLGGVRFYFKA